MYGFDHGVWMMGGWLVMLLVWLLPFALLFVALKAIFKRFTAGADKSALEILEIAYANGKIGREEFFRKRDDLKARPSEGVS